MLGGDGGRSPWESVLAAAAATKARKRSDLNDTLISHRPGGGKSKITVHTQWASPWGLSFHPTRSCRLAAGSRDHFSSSSNEGTDAFLTSACNYLPQAPPPPAITRGQGSTVCVWGPGNRNIQSVSNREGSERMTN